MERKKIKNFIKFVVYITVKSIEYSAKSKEKYVEHTLVFHERDKSGEFFLKNIIFLEKMDIPYSRKIKYVNDN